MKNDAECEACIRVLNETLLLPRVPMILSKIQDTELRSADTCCSIVDRNVTFLNYAEAVYNASAVGRTEACGGSESDYFNEVKLFCESKRITGASY